MSGSRNVDEIREIVSASLNANEPGGPEAEDKRDAAVDRAEEKASVDPEDDSKTREATDYDDEADEDEDENDRQVRQKSRADRSDISNDDELDPKNSKEVAKREARDENEYDEDDDDYEANPESVDSPSEDDPKAKIVERSAPEETNSESDKSQGSKDPSSLDSDDSDLDFEKAIENQIQQRIDAIKEDIKRQIEKKQLAREIEANNEKFDQLEFSDEEAEPAVKLFDSPKRSLDSVPAGNGDSDESKRPKRRSDLSEAASSQESKNLALPVKKRSSVRRVTLVQRKDARKRKDRSSILVPEQGHAELNDDLPADLTLDPKLRLSRSKDELPSARYRRDMSEELEESDEPAKLLFAPHEKSDSKGRRRRSRIHSRPRSHDRGRSQRRRRYLRRHRAARESPMKDAEERDKREMDEDAALVEYKESFGGFPGGEPGGALGRFKRIRRSSNVT
ncbi:protein starmaker-like [Venturia canescens]|uniref:protein starmaker-like n=1 Tax=Venturia canescens TaxID=32260 RepID=UPI001C9CB6B0|nr:protein starmaker-like [Venturia canescens]